MRKYSRFASLLLTLIGFYALSVVAGPYPYQSSMSNSSVLFGISTTRQFDGTSIKQPTQDDYGVGFSEHTGAFANHKALSWVCQHPVRTKFKALILIFD